MRRVVLILLALLVLAPTAVQAAVWYRCAHDGEARKACCCPSKAKEEGDRTERDKPPALSAGCCCEVTTIEAPKPSVRESAPIKNSVDMAPPALAALTVVLPESRPAQALRAVSIVPVRPPDPIFARNCALLL